MPITFVRRTVTWQDAIEGLRRIHGEVQRDFHDRWDWMDASFYVDVLEAHLAPPTQEGQESSDAR